MTNKITKAVIPAAGLGTRFLPATKAQPKEMLPILDKPTLQYIVEEAYKSGITDILVIIGRGKEPIVNHFDHSIELEAQLEKAKKFKELAEIRSISDKVNIFYVRQKEAKGLGHAILCAKVFCEGEPFAVLLGDDVIYTEKDQPLTKRMMDIYENKNSTVIAGFEVEKENISKYGIISGKREQDFLIKVDGLVEKPDCDDAPSNLAIAGRYIISPKIFEILERTKPGKNNEIQITDALLELLEYEDIYCYKFDDKRYDIGSKLGFVIANLEYGLRDENIRERLKTYLNSLNLDEF